MKQQQLILLQSNVPFPDYDLVQITVEKTSIKFRQILFDLFDLFFKGKCFNQITSCSFRVTHVAGTMAVCRRQNEILDEKLKELLLRCSCFFLLLCVQNVAIENTFSEIPCHVDDGVM